MQSWSVGNVHSLISYYFVSNNLQKSVDHCLDLLLVLVGKRAEYLKTLERPYHVETLKHDLFLCGRARKSGEYLNTSSEG